MKKIIGIVVFTAVLLMLSTVAGAEQFGDLTCKYDNGLTVLSSGGQGSPESFGFALSNGTEDLHIYHVGSDFESPYAAIFRNFPAKEVEIRQFSETCGVISYGSPIYVTLGDELSVVTLSEIKTSEKAKLDSFVDKSLYRAEQQLEIDNIILQAKTSIDGFQRKYGIESAVTDAMAAISLLKTDAEYLAEELIAAKEQAAAQVGSMADLSAYREAEVLVIEEIVQRYTGLINSATSIDAVNGYVEAAEGEISSVLTDEQLKSNALSNDLVLENLNAALTQLGNIKFFGNEKEIINILVPVIEEVVADGTYGRILITSEYVRSTYAEQIAEVKDIYNSMDETVERPGFDAKLAKIDLEVQTFLKEYFL